jgi:hypothetical protein
MDTGDLNDAYTVRSLDDLAKIYAKGRVPPACGSFDQHENSVK